MHRHEHRCNEHVRIPIVDVVRRYLRELVPVLLAATSTFLHCCNMTILGPSRDASQPGDSCQDFIEPQLLAVMTSLSPPVWLVLRHRTD